MKGQDGIDSNDKGNAVYKRFYLGSDESQAIIAATRIGQIWARCSKTSDVWTSEYLRLADAVSKGKPIDTTDLIALAPAGQQAAELWKLKKALPGVGRYGLKQPKRWSGNGKGTQQRMILSSSMLTDSRWLG